MKEYTLNLQRDPSCCFSGMFLTEDILGSLQAAGVLKDRQALMLLPEGCSQHGTMEQVASRLGNAGEGSGIL